MSGNISIESAAVKYADRGLHVFPVSGRTKRPMTDNGHLDASADPFVVAEMFRQPVETSPGAVGIGVHVGPSGLVLFDPDSDAAEAALRKRVGDKALSLGRVVLTSRGRHYYYRAPEGVSLNGVERFCGIENLDVRSGSSYGILPPSPHPSGKVYRFADYGMAEGVARFLDELAPCPPVLVEMLREHSERHSNPAEGLRDADGRTWLPKGTRNAVIFRAAAEARRYGADVEAVTVLAEVMGEKQCREQIPEREVAGIVKSVMRNVSMDRAAVIPEDMLITSEHFVEIVASEPWPDPLPIEAARARPAFPVDVFPGWLGEWVAAEAEATQTPADMAGVMSLAAVATTIQRAVEIDVGGWVEPLCIWSLAIMESGSRKSQVMGDVFAPIIAAESVLRDEYAPAEQERAGDEAAYAEGLKKLRTDEAKAIQSGDEEKREEARRKRTEAEDRLRDLKSERRPLPRLFAEDVTPERYLRLMQEQRGAITLASDEGGVFATFGGRYRQGGDAYIEPLLKAHAGSAIRVDRQNGEPISIDRPRGSIAVSLQEEALRKIGEIPGAVGLGLIARCMAVFPPDLIGTRTATAASVPVSTASAYSERMQALASLGYRAEGFYVLRLDEQARESFDTFRGLDHHEGRLIGDLAPIRAWGSKMPGLVARISGLLHMAEHGADGLRVPVSHGTVERAIRFAEDYLIPHAFVLHEVAAESAERRAARDILAWIIREGITEMTSRDATRAVRWLETKNGVRDSALALLVDPHGVLRLVSGKTGTREVRWVVNPKVHERADKADKAGAAGRRLSGLSALSGVPKTASEVQ
jgi:replicative DNA helicase